MDEKNMQFANFNITFGENDDPMLEHFEDIIYPVNANIKVSHLAGFRS